VTENKGLREFFNFRERMDRRVLFVSNIITVVISTSFRTQKNEKIIPLGKVDRTQEWNNILTKR
jgi:hypothetical protein